MSATITKDAADVFSDALADVLCWFHGFQSAYAGQERQPPMPPGLERVRDLKNALDAVRRGDKAEIDAPEPKRMPF